MEGFNLLYKLIQPHSSISIVGMCKNAGKTTVLNRIISDCAVRGECLGLTSIGRDGERSDVVTGTKKPEIFIYDGMLVATAVLALKLGTISREIVGTVDITTPMGSIVLARAKSDGMVQLAGPSMTAQLITVRDMLIELGATRVVIDGALSRKSLAMPAVSKGAVLCTGASYCADIRTTVLDTAYAVSLMTLPKTESKISVRDKKIQIISGDDIACFDAPTEAAQMLSKGGALAVVVFGGVTDSLAASLLTAGRRLDGVELICEDSSRLLLSRENAGRLNRAGVRLSVMNPMKLIAVTVNPFSAYGTHYDKNEFFDGVRSHVDAGIPVINILEEEVDA